MRLKDWFLPFILAQFYFRDIPIHLTEPAYQWFTSFGGFGEKIRAQAMKKSTIYPLRLERLAHICSYSIPMVTPCIENNHIIGIANL